MNTKAMVRGSLIAALCAAGAAFAQAQAPTAPTATMTDVTLPPAEERDSVGAVLLETSMVRAQQQAFGTRSTPAQVQAIGDGVMRATLAAARARDLGIPDTHELGGAPAAPAAPRLNRD